MLTAEEGGEGAEGLLIVGTSLLRGAEILGALEDGPTLI